MRFIQIFLFVTTLPLFAISDAEQGILSEGAKKTFGLETKTVEKGVMQETAEMTAEKMKKSAASSSSGASDIMIVDPKIMSQDWVKAFKALQGKNLTNISFILSGHPPIVNVSSIEPLPGGYLMLFTVKTIQGYKYEIVKTSSITSIEMQ